MKDDNIDTVNTTTYVNLNVNKSVSGRHELTSTESMNIDVNVRQQKIEVKTTMVTTVTTTQKPNPYAVLGRRCNLKRFFNMSYPNDTSNYLSPGEKRYIIYTCRGECGGLADQFKGITASYGIAKRSGRQLRIQETVKCGITTYLQPKQYDWTFRKNEVKKYKSTFCNTNNHSKTRRIKLNDYVLYLNESVIYLRTNRIYGKRDFEYRRLFRTTYNDLFDLKPEIKSELNLFRNTFVKKNKTVCAHLRVGKGPGFVDSKYNNLGNISEIWNFFSRYDTNGHVIYIATDSSVLREAARKRFPRRFIDMPGRVINTAFELDDESCSAFRKLILDFSFLASCDVLLLTFSDFGFHASLLRGSTDDQFCYQDGYVYPCPIYAIERKRSSEDMNPLLEV
ncbi:hypothetical protein FSP39_016254 [Pinctada imbricata]|uniref:Uncharacterized protein n=1 Tax=Pinctada imbricata TaxID=66713 RepID=A0AA89C995_PINIB|nr:hypothetical protein FSP39_016254 [Pinctada imbricata]